MNCDALQFTLDSHGLDLGEEIHERILFTYHELDVFEDLRHGIERLQAGEYEVCMVSNGNPEMLASMVDHADIGDLATDTICAHKIETFRPNREIYRYTARRGGTPIERILHVAGPVFDVQGAKSAGMQARGSIVAEDRTKGSDTGA
jgi:2-haloacid dehalogenase